MNLLQADVDGLKFYDLEQGRGNAISKGDAVVVSIDDSCCRPLTYCLIAMVLKIGTSTDTLTMPAFRQGSSQHHVLVLMQALVALIYAAASWCLPTDICLTRTPTFRCTLTACTEALMLCLAAMREH